MPDATAETPEAQTPPANASPPVATAAPESAAPSPSSDLAGKLPAFTRSLLNVKVPISVALATKKQSVQQVVELAPGSLIQFDKSCDQMLELFVGEHAVAEGVAVKVGEKFGLKINSLIPVSERMVSVPDDK
jgi:flagellar motor switch protein FliN/FliY